MDWQLKSREECACDMIYIGEIMLRIDPGDSRIKNARYIRG